MERKKDDASSYFSRYVKKGKRRREKGKRTGRTTRQCFGLERKKGRAEGEKNTDGKRDPSFPLPFSKKKKRKEKENFLFDKARICRKEKGKRGVLKKKRKSTPALRGPPTKAGKEKKRGIQRSTVREKKTVKVEWNIGKKKRKGGAG